MLLPNGWDDNKILRKNGAAALILKAPADYIVKAFGKAFFWRPFGAKWQMNQK